MNQLCGRCLVVFDACSSIAAVKGDERSPYEGRRQPTELAEWAAEKIVHGWTIEVDDTTRRFTRVATWYGDPVCEFHLWRMADREAKGEDYISSGRWRRFA